MPVIEPIRVDFGSDANKALEDYVDDNLRVLIDGHKTVFESDLPRWRKNYNGIPERESRDFPWKNASNLVVQVIGTYTDMLHARIMAGIHEILPLFVLELFGEWSADQHGDEQKQVLESFLNLMGLSQSELDLYRTESGVILDTIKYGFMVSKTPWVTQLETKVIGEREGKLVAIEDTIFDGPRPYKLAYETFLITPTAETIKDARFKAHHLKLTKYDLEDRVYQGVYEESVIQGTDKKSGLINSPDRSGVDFIRQQKEQQKGEVKTISDSVNAEWDIYECHFPYIHNNHKYRIIYTYHPTTHTCLRKIFNFMPDNEEVFHGARLGYEGDTIRGRGFCEMLKDYQQEFSTIHNQDNDAGTLANTSLYRLDPNSKLDAQFSIFPSACVVAREGEFEVFQMGRTGGDSLNRQQLLQGLITERAGVAPPSGGSGTGVTNPKKGIYSAMGTFATLQEGNRRTNINVADIRYYHLALGSYVLKLYAEFGIGQRAQLFGNKARILLKALENVKNKRIGISVRAATASINKEVEKQNDMLLKNVIQQHYMWVGGLLQTLKQAPLEMQEYLVKAITGGNNIMRQILRNFGYDDVERFIPDSLLVKELESKNEGQQQGAGVQPGGAGATTAVGNVESNAVLPASVSPQAGNANVVPIGGDKTVLQ